MVWADDIVLIIRQKKHLEIITQPKKRHVTSCDVINFLVGQNHADADVVLYNFW